jgi:hypothetical protein
VQSRKNRLAGLVIGHRLLKWAFLIAKDRQPRYLAVKIVNIVSHSAQCRGAGIRLSRRDRQNLARLEAALAAARIGLSRAPRDRVIAAFR